MPDPLALVLAPDTDAFVAAARPYLDDPDTLLALVPDLLRETALRHYRKEYPKHVPHALLALLGGLEAADLLDGAERVRPILQALSYVSKEKHFDPLPVATAPAPDRLLADGAADCFNLCHRFIYAAKVLQRVSRTPGLDEDALLTPVRHYHALAPEDGRFAEALAGSGGEAHLAAARDAATAAREGGARATGMLEDVFARAVRRMADVEGLGTVGWVGMAHVATFTEAARWWHLTSEAEERRAVPGIATLFLADSLEIHGHGEAETAGPAGGDPERLRAAIRARDPDTARAQAAALAGRPADHPALHRALLLACSEIDGHHAFSHDVKVTAAAVRLHRESRAPGIAGCLSDVAAFLAGLPAGSELADALFPRA